MSCCPTFPTPGQLKTQIQHSSQEGYTFEGFYCRPEVLGEQELKAQVLLQPPGCPCSPSSQAAATGGHCSITAASSTMNCSGSSQLLPASCFCLHNTSAIL